MNETTTEKGLGLAVVEKRGEMAVSASAAHAKAIVESRYLIALNRPRKPMEARAAILDACKRPKFAEVARYKKPVGKKQINGVWTQQHIEGLSVRFAETAIQAMKNISVESSVVYEDDDRRTIHVSVTDLESNLNYGEDITVAKTVERRNLKQGQEAISERVNSNGDKVYIVVATDDEIANKVAAQRSKVIRNCGLRLVPQDFLEEAEEQIIKTLEGGGGDPQADLKKIVDAFHSLGIKSSELEKYIGHALDSITKKEVADLRAVYTAIRDGEAAWTDYVDPNGPKNAKVDAPIDVETKPVTTTTVSNGSCTTIVSPPYDQLTTLLKADGITEEKLLDYLKSVKKVKVETKMLAIVPDTILSEVVSKWATLLPNLKV